LKYDTYINFFNLYFKYYISYLINKKLKKLHKKNKDEGMSFDDLKDNVKFGEQAYEPPTIKVLPKKRKLNVKLLIISFCSK